MKQKTEPKRKGIIQATKEKNTLAEDGFAGWVVGSLLIAGLSVLTAGIVN